MLYTLAFYDNVFVRADNNIHKAVATNGQILLCTLESHAAMLGPGLRS